MNTNLVEVFLHPPATETTSPWLQFSLKLLDWPFLIAVVLIIFAKPLKDLLGRAVLIKWKEGSIHLSNLEEKIDRKIDQEIDSKLEDYDEQETLKKSPLDTPTKKPQGVQFANVEQANAGESTVDALNHMKEALMSPKFRWRTVSRLAAIAGISESEAKALLPSLDVDFDVNKSGQRIAKLKSR